MYAHGVAAPALIAAADVAVATPSASDRSAIDCASVSAQPRIPCRNSPVLRERGVTGSVMFRLLSSVGKQCEDARGRAVRIAHLQRCDDDVRAFGQLMEVRRVLDDHPAPPAPHAAPPARPAPD